MKQDCKKRIYLLCINNIVLFHMYKMLVPILNRSYNRLYVQVPYILFAYYYVGCRQVFEA